jgi:citrate lyase subunit beta / citryl-CoA lyase
MSVPASSERFLAKARELAADEVMLDLEDSVAPAAKDTARDLAVGALKAGGGRAGWSRCGSTAPARRGPTRT